MSKKPLALEDRDQDGAKLFSPSAGRNKAVIAECLTPLLPHKAHVLEIAAGTGEQAIEITKDRPDIMWQYSDPDARSRSSEAAWAADRDSGVPWPEPLNIDVCAPVWELGLPHYDALYCANMIHIAPWEAALGLANGASALTTTVYLYGPFLLGSESAPSNLDFGVSLKQRDPRWGVRELEAVKHIFAKSGFTHLERFDMPRNNLIVKLSKR